MDDDDALRRRPLFVFSKFTLMLGEKTGWRVEGYGTLVQKEKKRLWIPT
jgi:hypothetical protein